MAVTYFPMLFVLSNSLKTGSSIFSGDVFTLFTQFDVHNYYLAATGIDSYLLNTVIIAIIAIVIGVGSAALGAYAFAQLKFRGKSLLFMAYVALLMIPWSLTLIPLYAIMLELHFYNTWWALIFVYAAGSQPLLMIIFRAFFEQIPQDLVASARIDGCSELKVMTKIIAPLTKPILFTGAVLIALGVWGDYLWPTIVLQNYHRFTISAGIQEFLGQFGQSIYGGGADFAAYVLATAPMFILVVAAGKYFIAGVTDGGLKM